MVIMKYNKFTKLFIPPIVIFIRNKWLNFVYRKTSYLSTIGKISSSRDSLIVIGNGPSLTDSIRRFKDEIMAKDSIAVNSFCISDYYTEIKPQYYLLVDPAYFGDIDTYPDSLKKVVLDFKRSMIDKTSWDINLIVPDMAKNSWLLSEVRENPSIHVYFFNMTNLVSVSSEKLKFKAWDNNLIAPPTQTCLNTCVWLGIFLRYKCIYLIGADTSWIEQLHVDQETNEVYTIDSHFYGKKKQLLYADVEGKVPKKLHEELNCISRALSLYWELKYYADYAGVKIFNLSKYSLIDAYERRKEIY